MRMLMTAMIFVAAVQAQPGVGGRAFHLEELRTQPGYEVSVFAATHGSPRMMTFGPNGVLYAAVRDQGTIVAIPRENEVITVLSGLQGPHTALFRDNDLYVMVDDGLLRYRNAVSSDLIVRGTPERLLSVPTGGHDTRTIGFSPDGKLFVTIGSSCNFCVESDPRRAAMMRYEVDGSGETVYARGLRNSVGFAWHPVTGDLWAPDNGGDGLGDDVPPEEINFIEAGVDYGWPDCAGDRRGVDWGPAARPERCAATRAPAFTTVAHSAPLGISFYAGDQFPASFVNDALVGLHGSWNRHDPSGAKVIRVRSSEGRPTGEEDFLWGFYDAATRTRSGRPVHAIAGPDGAVYVSDDGNGNIYRVSYTGPRITPGGVVRSSGRVYELYGRNLVGSAGETAILYNGSPAEILFASPIQVNFLVPEGLTGEVRVSVKTSRAEDQAVIRID
jgi:glucose/arabinose dehydrogenase